MRLRCYLTVWASLVAVAACGTTTFADSVNDGSANDAERADATHPAADAPGPVDAGRDAITDATSRGMDAGRADVGIDAGHDANDGCAFFCDNFDEYAGTTLPSSKWLPGVDGGAPVVLSTAEALSGSTSALATIAAVGNPAGQTVSAVHTSELMGQATAGLAFDTDVYVDPGMAAGLTAKPTGIVLAVAVGSTVFAIEADGSGASESYEVIEAVGKKSFDVLGPLSVAVPNAKWTHVRFLVTPSALVVVVMSSNGTTTETYSTGNPTQFTPADLTSATATISIGLTSVVVTGGIKVYYDNVVIGLP
jgi:hypothetical protein